MMKAFRGWTVAAVVAPLALVAPRASASIDPGPEPARRYVPVDLRTDFADEDPGRARRIRPLLKRTAAEALGHEHGVEVLDGADAILVIYVRNLEEDPNAKRSLAVMDYGVRLEVQVNGNSVGDEVVFCTQKGEAELVECAIGGLDAVLQYLPTEAVPPPDRQKLPPPQLPEQPVTPDRLAPIGPVAASGIALGVGGVVATALGGADLARGQVSSAVPGTGNERTDYRQRGRLLLGV
jgi:hypothetical protein